MSTFLNQMHPSGSGINAISVRKFSLIFSECYLSSLSNPLVLNSHVSWAEQMLTIPCYDAHPLPFSAYC